VAASVAARHRGTVETRLVEGLVSEDPRLVADRILAQKPDWVGLSIYSWNRSAFSRIAGTLAEVRPELVVFCGGPEATADPFGLLAEARFAFVIAGEGETAAAEAIGVLLAAGRGGASDEALRDATKAALSRVPGVALPAAPASFRRAPAEDPARLESPWLAGILDPRQYGGALWELARGCPFSCSYCYESKGERGVRLFPLGRIEAELDLFASAAPLSVFVLDPTFNADRERASALLRLFRERAPGLRFKFEIRAEFIDKALARAFAGIDCSLQIGLQSSNAEVLAAVGRPGFDPEGFARKVRVLEAEGLVYGLDLIYGLPGDCFAGFKRSLDYALALRPNHLDVFPLAVLPGTDLADRADSLGLVVERGSPHLLLSSPSFPISDMAKARALARAVDLFYSRGRAVAWFPTALAPIKSKPAAFLSRFAERGVADAAEPSSEEIEGAQLSFLEGEYERKGLGNLLPALRDLVRLHGAYGRAVAEGIATEIDTTYDYQQIMGPAGLDLPAFARAARPKPGRARLEAGSDGVRITRAGGRSAGRGGRRLGAGRRG